MATVWLFLRAITSEIEEVIGTMVIVLSEGPVPIGGGAGTGSEVIRGECEIFHKIHVILV